MAKLAVDQPNYSGYRAALAERAARLLRTKEATHGLRHSPGHPGIPRRARRASSRREIKPLEQQDDNIRFFDHRREHARTDWDKDGLPRKEWEELLGEARRRADAAGHLRYAWPIEWGGKGGTNLAMAIIREHLAAKGLGLHNDLQTEHSIVGNNPFIIMFKEFATNAQYERYARAAADGRDPHRLRPDRAEPRLRRHLHGDPRRAPGAQRRARLADQRREDVDHRHARGATTSCASPAPAGRTATPRGITVFLVPAERSRA